MVQPARTQITAADYFQLPEYEAHDLIELINGEVILAMPPVPRHQRIVREIFVMFALLARRKGGETLASPIEVFLDERNVFEPDLLYLRPDSRCTVGEKRLTGAPDLVVEVLSPGPARYDRQQKYEAYQQHGVNEYWIVDPAYEMVEVWILGPDQRFERLGAFSAEDSFQSVVLGEAIGVKEIFTP